MAEETNKINPPPLFMGVVLLFWGWRTGLLPPAVAMAITIEGARFVSLRWQFSDKDINRLVDVTSVIVLAVAVFMYTTRSTAGFFMAAQWLPAMLFFVAGSQIYSSQGTLPLNALFISLRRKKLRQESRPERRVDIRFPYVAICLLAASMVTVRTPWFYVGICALSAWGLWSFRPRRYHFLTWGGMLLSVIALGYVGHNGLNRLQGIVVDLAVDLMVWSDKDPYQSITSMGHIGQLKLSERILLRVKLPREANGNLLLRQASYDAYASGTWRAANARFEAVAEAAAPGAWQFGETGPLNFAVTVSGYLRRGRGILAIPNGSSRIENLPAGSLNRSSYGVVRVDDAPGMVNYTASYRPNDSLDIEPTEKDLYVPNRYEPMLGELVTGLELSNKDPNAALASLQHYFLSKFSYTLVKNSEENYAPLAEFLTGSRSGHCEYFATATALLLRAAGIPTRYATGYSVQEYSELDDMYVVRQRHAHAWALAYIDGSWRDVDFTPPSWIMLENQAAPWWQIVYDFGSHMRFLFSNWRWSEHDAERTDVLIWLLMPLALLLGWRLYLKGRIRRPGSKKGLGSPVSSGSDHESTFNRIVRYLTRSGLPRRPGETLNQWIHRITDGDSFAMDKDELQMALAFHYRARFDPQGLLPAERERLQSAVSKWIARR